MVSSYLSVYIFSILTMSSITLMHRTTGRFIFCCSHCLHNRQQTEFESESCRSDGVLPTTECCNAFPDLAADSFHSPTGHHPFDSPSPFPHFQPILIRYPCECLLVHGPHLQPFRGTPRNTRTAMGPRLHACLPALQ